MLTKGVKAVLTTILMPGQLVKAIPTDCTDAQTGGESSPYHDTDARTAGESNPYPLY